MNGPLSLALQTQGFVILLLAVSLGAISDVKLALKCMHASLFYFRLCTCPGLERPLSTHGIKSLQNFTPHVLLRKAVTTLSSQAASCLYFRGRRVRLLAVRVSVGGWSLLCLCLHCIDTALAERAGA